MKNLFRKDDCNFLSAKQGCTAVALILSVAICFGQTEKLEVTIKPSEDSRFMTQVIQQAIDSCASNGGGIIKFSTGTYLSGTINMKSKVAFYLMKGAIIKGSSNYADYTNDAFIYGDGLTDIGFTGEGKIDGVDCINNTGEEGFRGPHCFKLVNCTNLLFKGITIVNSANWAINCRYCKNGTVENVTILGGHDGLHTRFCENFTVTGCDFQTGDDCFAGNDNQNFIIKDCKANTSCNAFRLGCLNLLVEKCRIWGPGVYAHKIENAVRMPTAFVHFSPDDEPTKIPSGNWLIKDVIIDSADYVYVYNFENGLWQTGHPATNIKFENVKAVGLLKSFYMIGDKQRSFNLSVTNSSFAYRNGNPVIDSVFEDVKWKSTAFFYAENFNTVTLKNIAFLKTGKQMLFDFNEGNKVNLLKIKRPIKTLTSQFHAVKKVTGK